jgi:hypothetical protein
VQTNIHLVGVRGVTITGNTLWQGYEHNMLVEDSYHVIVGTNMLERNPLYGYTSEGKDSVVLRGCRDCTIQGLHLHHVIDSEAGLTIEKCERIHLVGCTILDCDGAGLLIKASSQIHYDDCFIGESRPDVNSVHVRVVDGDGMVVEERK